MEPPGPRAPAALGEGGGPVHPVELVVPRVDHHEVGPQGPDPVLHGAGDGEARGGRDPGVVDLDVASGMQVPEHLLEVGGRRQALGVGEALDRRPAGEEHPQGPPRGGLDVGPGSHADAARGKVRNAGEEAMRVGRIHGMQSPALHRGEAEGEGRGPEGRDQPEGALHEHHESQADEQRREPWAHL